MVAVLPLSAVPAKGMNKLNFEVPELVAVNPVSAPLDPLKRIFPVANCEVVIVIPVKEAKAEAVHEAHELSEAVIVPPAMVLSLPARVTAIVALPEPVTVRPPAELREPRM